MIYRIDFCGNEACSYTFIYDDTGKSVLYRPVKDGVDYPSLNIFYGEPNVSKLKLCGFSECYETLELHYCDYWIDDWYVKVYIYYYLDFFDSEISFKFYERSGKLAYLHLVDNCIVLPKSSYDWCGGEYTFTGIYMDIPVYMLSKYTFSS